MNRHVLAMPSPPRPQRNPDEFAPLFIVSPARGFSSVCTTMIGRHPDLYGFPELILFVAPTVGQLLDLDERKAEAGLVVGYHSGLYRAIAELHDGEQGEQALRRAAAWLAERRSWPVAHVYDHLLEAVAPRIGVEKSPETSQSFGPLARLAALYPRARFLHLTRHPVTSLHSMLEHWEGRPWWPKGMDQPGPTWCAHTWRDTHRRILAFTDTLESGRVMRVRGEDLINDGGVTLRAIAEWLGVRTDDAAIESMRHPEESPYAAWGPRGFAGGLDPKFMSDPSLRPARLPDDITFDPAWNLGAWLEVDCAVLAAELGYQPTS